LTGTARIEAGELRTAGGLMLAAAAVLGSLPGHPGLPCPLRTLTGVPCPLCGMTTSVEATVHGHVGQALAANPAGVVAVAVAVFLVVRCPSTLRVSIPLVLVALALMWAFELARFGVV
jgi:uncharacterized protein DUF2752